jgi:Na+/H+-dicarboxylate symporter
MKSRLAWWVLVAMITGPLVGLLLQHVLSSSAAIGQANNVLSLITTAFLRLIKMIVAPLVFCTLTVGVAKMEGAASIVRVGARTLGWFIFATLLSMCIGLAVVQLVKPGLVLTPPLTPQQLPAHRDFALAEVIEHVIPSSLFQALANNEILQIVVFSVLFGAAASSLGSRVEPLIRLIDQAAAIILKITGYVMSLAPIAIFAALAVSVMSQGVEALAAYAKFILAFYAAILILWTLLGSILYLRIGRRAGGLYRAMREPLLLAFSTASSEAVYPQTLKSLQGYGVSPRIASFVLPLGYSFNLDGSALYCSMGVLFIAQIFRIDMGVGQQIAMVGILMVMSKGVAGVPRAGLMIVASSLSYFGLPEQGLVFVVAVDHIIDMGRTATNVIGNAIAATLVARWEGELQESVV